MLQHAKHNSLAHTMELSRKEVQLKNIESDKSIFPLFNEWVDHFKLPFDVYDGYPKSFKVGCLLLHKRSLKNEPFVTQTGSPILNSLIWSHRDVSSSTLFIL